MSISIYLYVDLWICLYSIHLPPPSGNGGWTHKGALQLLSNRSKQIRFAQVPERNSGSSSDSNLSAIYP